MQFIIPFRKDSISRYNNLKLVIEYIQSNFKHNILVAEYDVDSKIDLSSNVEHLFIKSNSKLFNKSRCINTAISKTTSEYICICDSDVLFDVVSFNNGLDKLVNRDCGFCLPYNSYVYNISVNKYIANKKSLKDTIQNKKLYSRSSIGGIILFDRKSFSESGKYNEKFEGWGNEDYEFWLRINKLNFNIIREDGCLYHLNHFRFHPQRNMKLMGSNKKELDKIKKMDIKQIKTYYRIGDVE